MDPKELKALLDIAFESFPHVTRKFGEGRTGGFLYISNEHGLVSAHVCLGTPDPKKYDKYNAFSEEKACRLRKRAGEGLSFQSRNPDKDQYAGAFRAPDDRIISFSGLPEMIDEAYVACLAVKAGWVGKDMAEQILEKSGNVVRFREVWEVVNSLVRIHA